MSDVYIRNLPFKPNTAVILIYCIFYKGLPPSYHRKSIRWKISPSYLKSTLLPSDNSFPQSFPCCKFELRLLKFVALFSVALLFYFLIISHCKVKPNFHGCNYFIFDRIRRKCSMFRNANFYRFRLTVEVLLIYLCQNFHFRTYFCLFW